MALVNIDGILVNVTDDDEFSGFSSDSEATEEADSGAPVSGIPGLESKSDCSVCGVAIPYGGRGKPATKCAEHRSTKGNGNISPNRNAGSGGDSKAKSFPGEGALRVALTNRYYALSGMVGMLTRDIGAMNHIRESTAKVVDADIEYARSNPSFRRWLEGGVEKSAAAAVVVAHVQMFAPVVIEARKRSAVATADTTNPIVAMEGRPNVTPIKRFGGGPFARTPKPTTNPPPKPTDGFYPAEHARASGQGDTINAGLIPGMPGL